MTIERFHEPKTSQQVDVIAAQPGFNLITQVHDDGGIVDVWRETILAWRIDTTIYGEEEERDPYSYAWPVTTEGDVQDRGDWAVEFPDGHCCITGNRTFENAAELLKHWQQQAVVNRG